MTLKAKHPTFAQILERRRWTVGDAEVVLSAWRESGDTLSRFANRHGLVAWRLMRWRRRLGRKPGTIQFHRVRVMSSPRRERPPVAGGLELVLRDGRRVAVHGGFDASVLEDLVRTVESWSC